MKDSGVEWIGEIPEEWKVKRGKELFHEINDRCVNPEDYRLLSVSEYYGVAPKSEKIDEGDFETHAETLEGYKLCKAKDIVMNIMLAWKRATGMSEYEGLISPAYCIYRSNGNLCEKYYHYLLRTDEYAGLFKQYSTGIIDSRLRLYPNKFLGLKYHYPPKETQQKIATYLDEKCSQIEQTIQNQQQVIEKLKAYKQSLITEAVTGKVKIQNGKVAGKYEQYKDSGVEWIGEIPSGWSCAQLKNLYKFLGGFAFNSDDYVEESNNQVLRIGNVKDFKILFDSSPVYISNELAEKVDNFRLKPGYILFTMTGTRGKKDYFYTHEVNKNDCLKKNIYLNQRVGCLIPIANICSSFFNYLLKEKLIKDSVFLTETGTANQANIGSEDVMKTKVHLPPKEEQKSIAEYLDKTCVTIDSAIEQKQMLIEKLTEYKKSLIYECVTGKKEI